jgi:hypothetical protein
MTWLILEEASMGQAQQAINRTIFQLLEFMVTLISQLPLTIMMLMANITLFLQ